MRRTTVNLTEATDAQVKALQKSGFGNFTHIVRIAIDRMYREEVRSVAECDHPKKDRWFSEDGLLEWCGKCGVLVCDHHLRKFGKPHPSL